jgi:hypothetical protein
MTLVERRYVLIHFFSAIEVSPDSPIGLKIAKNISCKSQPYTHHILCVVFCLFPLLRQFWVRTENILLYQFLKRNSFYCRSVGNKRLGEVNVMPVQETKFENIKKRSDDNFKIAFLLNKDVRSCN